MTDITHSTEMRGLTPLRIALSSLLVLLGADVAIAYYAPLQATEAWTEQNGNVFIVRFRVYDPVAGTWMNGNSGYFEGTSVQLVHQSGVVAWLTSASTTRNVHWRVYDPVQRNWVGSGQGFESANVTLLNKDGVVAWLASDSRTRNVNWRIYDASRGAWMAGGQGFESANVTLLNKDGVVAWLASDSRTRNVNWCIYDPSCGQWRQGGHGFEASSASISIDNATVTYYANGTPTTVGYDAPAGQWSSNPTVPFSAFAAAPNNMNAPVTVWFTDMSIAGTAWSWSFGDGGNSSSRSAYRTYTGFGIYAVTFQVTGPGGSHSTTMQIKTDVNAPNGSVVVNAGAMYSTNQSVALTLSATDNSGSVSSMRFSNDGIAWSGWETYGTSKHWSLSGADGTNTVFAQFRDAALNESSACSDSIVLDCTPPVGGALSATGGYHTVNLNWSGFSDALSGLSNFTLTYRTNGVPGPWPDGTLAYSGTNLTYHHTNLYNGTTYSYRLTAFDSAGNCSTGLVVSATPSAGADTDADGMPDWWEEQYFGGGTNGAAGDDTDNDGMKNWEEFIAGTNPTNNQSVFAFTFPGDSSAPNVLRWFSATDRYYELLKSTNLTTGFSVLDSWILGTPPLNTYTDASASSAASFCRLIVSAPDVRAVGNELMGTGNGTSSHFAGGLAHTNVVPKSLSVVAGFPFSDNGHGLLSGLIGSGTINYTNGEWSLTLMGPLGNGVPITADYRYIVRR